MTPSYSGGSGSWSVTFPGTALIQPGVPVTVRVSSSTVATFEGLQLVRVSLGAVKHDVVSACIVVVVLCMTCVGAQTMHMYSV